MTNVRPREFEGVTKKCIVDKLYTAGINTEHTQQIYIYTYNTIHTVKSAEHNPESLSENSNETVTFVGLFGGVCHPPTHKLDVKVS